MSAEDELQEVMRLLETEPEPSSGPGGGLVPSARDIPALREQLAVLVSTGKAKEAIGTQMTHDQVKRLSDKDVEKYIKRYETYVGSKTTESLIDSFLFLTTKAVGMTVKIKDIEAYQKELRDDYILNKELSNLAGNLALKCGFLPRPTLCSSPRNIWILVHNTLLAMNTATRLRVLMKYPLRNCRITHHHSSTKADVC